MTEEFYKKNIFGEVVNLDRGASDEEDFSDELSANAEKKGFNIFSLTDALGARRKKEAWVLCQKALAAGFVAEEIFWKLVWIVKSMLLAQRTKSYKETEMKEFPYNKAKGFLKNWGEGELEKLSEDLVIGYHQARRGEEEMETLVEKILLNL